ncbi:type 2 isopentenyl-diphosphate Delta-isomerase [Furfurilactobacillus curtus]|uniref:Isopentenyl-diphosphate delta-isomerase n=1 Tax=Furfurilactobacillus curtus TaxID=1746200 RepID=A0ABQ5JLI2_9LACO
MAKTTPSAHAHRKDEHLAIAEKRFKTAASAGFDQVRLIHRGLPELDQNDIRMKSQFGDLSLDWPFYIEAMTGGSPRTGIINEQLARVAAASGIAMAVGSQSIAISEPEQLKTFKTVRENNPNGVIFANVGAGVSVAVAQQAVEMIQANALEVHINSVQELIMPEGDRNFHWLARLTNLINAVDVPVIVKEVGFGMSRETAVQLEQSGIKYVNISGRGGTNFAQIENERLVDHHLDYLSDWGQTTVESLLELQKTPLHVAASGGVRTPLDVIKSLVLGADAVGVAGYFLHELMTNGETALLALIQQWQQDLRKLYLLAGCQTTAELRQAPYILSSNLLSYRQQRQF